MSIHLQGKTGRDARGYYDTKGESGRRLSTNRLLNIPVGLLINFHVMLLRDGIRRIVNDYGEESSLEVTFPARVAKCSTGDRG
jgi:hypothetical protein